MNDKIRAEKVRLINDDGSHEGVVTLEDALAKAKAAGFDLVEVFSETSPPVCKILDYGKHRYKQSKKSSTGKKQHSVQIKEIRLRPKIGDHDLQVKMNKVRGFLDKRNKVLVTVLFRGREMAHLELGEQLLQRVSDDLGENAKVEREPRREGRRMNMIICPK